MGFRDALRDDIKLLLVSSQNMDEGYGYGKLTVSVAPLVR